MARILGLDLGTNSIGWAIRETSEDERIEYLSKFKNGIGDSENQIVDYGVVVFKKGVGDGTSGEFSLAAERRKNRSRRRLYNAKRYRKWELLKVLIENNMCPLPMHELRLWSVGEWINENGKWKNKGRKYPLNRDFIRWFAMDFNKIGNKYDPDEKLKPEFENPYSLRCFLLENTLENNQKEKYMIGRALYHFAQRRGFKSSRKGGKSTYAENKDIEEKKQKDPNFHISKYALEKIKSGQRFRNSGVIQRKYYEEEFLAICKKQNIHQELTRKLFNAVFYVRPLRSQKGLVGKCTLEKDKARIPISHPYFEEYRALAFINNIKWRETGSNSLFQPIPIGLKKDILEKVFFKRKKNGAVDTRSYFKFEEIVKKFSNNHKYEFNFAKYNNEKLREGEYILISNPIVSTCPVIAGLINVFNDSWTEKFIQNNDKYGINWSGLSLQYQVKYGTKKEVKRRLDFEGIWHLLFDYILIKDAQEGLSTFCKEVLGWDETKTNQFIEIDIPQGYGSLSRNAITKILPYLQSEHIYTEAVFFANLDKVFGKEYFTMNQETIKSAISETINNVNKEKVLLNIVNGLIRKFFAEQESIRAKGLDEQLKKVASEEVIKSLLQHFGENDWNKMTEQERNFHYDYVLTKYLKFLDGKQEPQEKASYSRGVDTDIDYYLIPRLDEKVKNTLKEKFNVKPEFLKYLYHPSDIDIYPKPKKTIHIVDRSTGEVIDIPQLEDPMPPTKGWKNPMAMRTMYELKHLVNHLLQIRKIDIETKIVIEMARELNDSNRRWAIQTYQKRREEENKEFAKVIIGLAKEKYPNLNENDAENIEKIRLWWEQLENGTEIYKQIKNLQDDVEKYRLWKEQKCICLYTGKHFSLTDLFDGTKTQFEHTFPISDSFDDSLANKTICDARYNMNIKRDQIPTQLKNYNEDADGYSAIKPRLKPWIDLRNTLFHKIEENKKETKKAIRSGNIEKKNYLIRQRHLLQFDFNYWDKKVKTFTLNEIPQWWKNSQLVDTQIITKYARAYLKSLFHRVDVIKAKQNTYDSQDGMANIFKKIYQIKGDEQKDRSKHCHHAIDAAVLTLIPNSAKRENILQKYYKALNNNQKYHTKPYLTFHESYVTSIENNVLINHVNRDRTSTPTRKKARIRGKVQKTRNGNIMLVQGKSIRGQLHKESYFGMVQVPERNEEGYVIRENGKIKVKKDEFWVVMRKPMEKVKISKDEILDKVLEKYIISQLRQGKKITEVVDFQKKPIRHIRCRVKAGRGYLTKEKAILLKKHTYVSKKEYKRYVLAQNEENYLFLFYEDRKNNSIRRSARIISLFEWTQFGYSRLRDIWADSSMNQTANGIPLKHILKVGDKLLLYIKYPEELIHLDRDELQNRLFKVYKFNDIGSTKFIYLQNHMEARPEEELSNLEKGKDGFPEFNDNTYMYRLRLNPKKLNCLFEGRDFVLNPDGELLYKCFNES